VDTANWDYSPLSSTAGRSGTQVPLYALPTSYSPDKEYEYFTSSMPVVNLLTQSNGNRRRYRLPLVELRL